LPRFSCGAPDAKNAIIKLREISPFLSGGSSRILMRTFSDIIERLRRYYGPPAAPPAHGPFELVLWENACYLLPDERRLEVFQALREKVGLNAAAIDAAPDRVLLPIALRGGMRPEMRVFRWREIARITLDQYHGDLDSILDQPYAEAKKALKQFPAIGEPGAEKILLLCGISGGLPLDSNGLRVIFRLGWGQEQKSYQATYRSVQEAIKPELPSQAESLKQAHLLLRVHGKTLCNDKAPLCHACPVSSQCDYGKKAVAPPEPDPPSAG
jgi:endonuclease III